MWNRIQPGKKQRSKKYVQKNSHDMLWKVFPQSHAECANFRSPRSQPGNSKPNGFLVGRAAVCSRDSFVGQRGHSMATSGFPRTPPPPWLFRRLQVHSSVLRATLCIFYIATQKTIRLLPHGRQSSFCSC